MAAFSHSPATDTGVRIASLQLDNEFFAVEYHRRDWSKAIAAACRWKEQGLIDAADLDSVSRLILTRADWDGELRPLPPVDPHALPPAASVLGCLFRMFKEAVA